MKNIQFFSLAAAAVLLFSSMKTSPKISTNYPSPAAAPCANIEITAITNYAILPIAGGATKCVGEVTLTNRGTATANFNGLSKQATATLAVKFWVINQGSNLKIEVNSKSFSLGDQAPLAAGATRKVPFSMVNPAAAYPFARRLFVEVIYSPSRTDTNCGDGSHSLARNRSL